MHSKYDNMHENGMFLPYFALIIMFLRVNIACYQKAFDMIEWRSIAEVLGRFGFVTVVINLVDVCVKENDFSLLVNGNSTLLFIATRHLRQGDSLSPTLFILVEEILSISLT